MNYRIAIASKDGKVVTDHFGHCSRFIIVEVDISKYRFIEQREVNPPCSGGVHTINGIKEVLEILRDCRYILVNQIGGGAEQIINANGFEVVSYKGYVTDALDQIILNHLL
jgi:predicted Fe-Mo cluster-binding NifX family protein